MECLKYHKYKYESNNNIQMSIENRLQGLQKMNTTSCPC